MTIIGFNLTIYNNNNNNNKIIRNLILTKSFNIIIFTYNTVPCFKEILWKYLTVLRHSKMFFVLKFELIGSNNVLTEGARKVYRGRRVGQGWCRANGTRLHCSWIWSTCRVRSHYVHEPRKYVLATDNHFPTAWKSRTSLLHLPFVLWLRKTKENAICAASVHERTNYTGRTAAACKRSFFFFIYTSSFINLESVVVRS
jgi:hypothetical protein